MSTRCHAAAAVVLLVYPVVCRLCRGQHCKAHQRALQELDTLWAGCVAESAADSHWQAHQIYNHRMAAWPHGCM